MPVVVTDVWTDGSGTTRGNPGGWAYVLHAIHPVTGEAHQVENTGWEFDTTNNRMEMTALLMGLRALKRPAVVVVHADSEYVINPFRENWIAKWEARNWTKVKNVDLWHQLIPEVRRHTLVNYEWVKGHNKVPLNERCDELAGQSRRHAIQLVADGVKAAQDAQATLL